MSSETSLLSTEERNENLVFLHLSDIHFHTRSGDHFDLDKDLRHQLEEDVQATRPALGGPVAAVLVSGDVGFSGLQKEYEVAADWLDRVCALAGCDTQNVLVVPGNHDVHRPTAAKGMLDLLRAQLRQCTPEEIDAHIAKYLPGNRAFLEPVSAFNSFAARYGCSIEPDKLYWERLFPLSDGSHFSWRGMTTTLVSDALDHRETAPLVLGTIQSQLRTQAGIIHGVLAHHPPEWLRDEDTVRPYLNSRSALQLYGHKHRQNVYRTDDSVIVSAGAVHPSRREQAWNPCFNFLSLSVEKADGRRRLQVTVHSRVWKPNETRFGPGDDYSASLPLPPWEQAPHESTLPSLQEASGGDEPQECPMSSSGDAYRRLVWGFHSPGLGLATKLDILGGLDLFSDEDAGATPVVLFERAFSRAAERGLLSTLWDRVNVEVAGALGENPFPKEDD